MRLPSLRAARLHVTPRSCRRAAGTWLRLGAATGLATLASLGVAPPASAHTTDVASEPRPGQVVEVLDRIVLRFGEPVELEGSAIWLADDGGAFGLPRPTHPGGDRRVLAAPVPAVGRGTYSVGWRAVGEDASVIFGTFVFDFGEAGLHRADGATASGPIAESHLDTRLGVAQVVARMALDLGVAAAVGAVVFLVVVWPAGTSDRWARTFVWVALAAAATAGLLLAVTQLAVANGAPVTDGIVPAGVGDLLKFRFGRVAATRLLLLGVAGALVWGLLAGGARVAASWAWRMAGVGIGLGVLQTLGAVGHSAGAGPLGMSARLVHMASVSVWLGGLFLLVAVVAPRKGARPLDELLPRFSTVAGGAVVTLVSSGLAMALDLVGSPVNLMTTPYGRTLVLKAAVVAAVLVVAQRSRAVVRERMVPALSGGGHARPGGLATAARTPVATRSPVATWIVLEVAGMVAVVGISALLTAQPTPA